MKNNTTKVETGKKLIKKGEERLKESEKITSKAKNILDENIRKVKKYKTRIEEGEMIKDESANLLEKGGILIEKRENNSQMKEIGKKNIIMGKRLKRAGETRVKNYQGEKEKSEEWIEHGKELMEKGEKIEEIGEELIKTGKRLKSK